jgi:hypothetical protein
MRIWMALLITVLAVAVVGCITTKTIGPDGSVTTVKKLDVATLADLIEKGVDVYEQNKDKGDKPATASTGNAVQDYIAALELKVAKMPDGAEKTKLLELIANAKEQLAKT